VQWCDVDSGVLGASLQVQCVFTRLGRGKFASLTSADAHKLTRLQLEVPLALTLHDIIVRLRSDLRLDQPNDYEVFARKPPSQGLRCIPPTLVYCASGGTDEPRTTNECSSALSPRVRALGKALSVSLV
jgi:hypothetical protein